MSDHYDDREQTLAKHFILRRYLQTLVFKWLSSASEITYVDAFSGPWDSRASDFSDTSFMIAINVLKDAHAHFAARGVKKTIRCCFVERDAAAFALLQNAVEQHSDPSTGFHVATFHGRFEDKVAEIQSFVGSSFSLVFIDPTGWTGYPYSKIAPVLQHSPGEVLVNFMYDFFNRFVASDDPKIIASFDSILGGPGWKGRLDPTLPPGRAARELCLSELRKIGAFEYVVSTTIDKTEADRPHYSIAYGTRKPAGLIAFREVELTALRGHEKRRALARDNREVQRTGQGNLFDTSALPTESVLDQLLASQRSLAKTWLVEAILAS